MAKIKFLLAATPFLALAACGQNPDAAIEKGCLKMNKTDDSMTKAESEAFCSCLSDNTENLTDEDKLTLGKLMTSAETGEEFRQGMEDAASNGDLSQAGAADFFTAAKTCSLEAGM